jgi:hypothetical protein
MHAMTTMAQQNFAPVKLGVIGHIVLFNSEFQQLRDVVSDQGLSAKLALLPEMF